MPRALLAEIEEAVWVAPAEASLMRLAPLTGDPAGAAGESAPQVTSLGRGVFRLYAAGMYLMAASLVAPGMVFSCTPTRVWDGDGPIWCAEGPKVRLAGIAAREVDETCRPAQTPSKMIANTATIWPMSSLVGDIEGSPAGDVPDTRSHGGSERVGWIPSPAQRGPLQRISGRRAVSRLAVPLPRALLEQAKLVRIFSGVGAAKALQVEELPSDRR